MQLPTALRRTDYAYSSYTFIAAPEHSAEFASTPEFFQHVAAGLKARDVLEVIAADNSFEVRLRVLRAGKGVLSLRRIGYIGPDEARTTTTESGRLTVGWGGPKHQWRIVDNGTKQPVATGFATKEEAEGARDNLLAQRLAA